MQDLRKPFDEKEAEREISAAMNYLQYYQKIVIPDQERIIKEYVYEQRMYHDCYSGLTKYEDECARSNKRMLKVLRRVKGRTFVKRFLELAEDCEGVRGKIYLSKNPKGTKYSENEYGPLIKHRWVDQRSVGMEGDSFEGTVSVEVKPNKYLCFDYSM
jgi:hypothetical protein